MVTWVSKTIRFPPLVEFRRNEFSMPSLPSSSEDSTSLGSLHYHNHFLTIPGKKSLIFSLGTTAIPDQAQRMVRLGMFVLPWRSWLQVLMKRQ